MTAVLRIGTRGSRLAMTQSSRVADAISATGRSVRLVVISTAGDRRAPDVSWPEGAFVDDLRRSLRGGIIDVAVHSAKDVPLPVVGEGEDVVIAAYPEREDPRDALILPAKQLREARAPARTRRPSDVLRGLAGGAVVGTDSPRRGGFLLAERPDVRVRSLTGNVDTRLARLDAGEVDALVLAVAGLVRLGAEARITQIFEADVMPPAAGQGALAVETRADDATSRDAVVSLDDPLVRAAVEAERAVLAGFGGGCRAPLGAVARIDAGRMWLQAGCVGPDGHGRCSTSVDVALAEAPLVGWDIGRRLARGDA